MTPTVRRSPTFAAVLVLALPIGCSLPIDPAGTTDRVRGGVVRVGAAHHPPWVDVSGAGPPKGSEIELVARLAEHLGARVEWTVGGESELMLGLEKRRHDLLVGGISERTAWKGKVGLSKPHARDESGGIVLACPPGENGWLLLLNRWIATRGRDELEEGGP